MNVIILELVSKISAMPEADRIFVFGSAALGVENPGDLDIVFVESESVNFTECKAKHDAALRWLLTLARERYGYLDVFVMAGNDLYVRNDHSTGWIPAKNKRAILASIAACDVSISALAGKLCGG